ncbi:hypothetical protein PVIIG_05593 [Plasmodium vivax India VII]|uniref:PIR Superfamily Protein n=1 Tax=Plasmodium vivax India VII TaxID=1077284 RepID=A0A0J9S384_PLAVI|nr:hypothetical protein PVIIG_05593 [Plasmodium vivax India VII]
MAYCNSFSHSERKIKNPNISKGICEDFTKLYKSLANFEGVSSTNTLNKNDWGVLNYWLNYKFKEIKINESICINDFYDTIEPYFNHIFQDGLAMDKIYNIKNDDFNNMKALYFLYKKYSKLHNILCNTSEQKEEVTLDSTNDCFVDYIKARSSCIGKNNPYCKKLEKFKSKYQELFSIQGIKKEDFNNNFKKLPEDSDFTPFVQIFSSKKENLTKKHIQNCNEIPKIALMDCENKHKNLYQNTYYIDYHAARNL